MKRTCIVAFLIAVAAASGGGSGRADDKDVSALMRKKLLYSQQVLEGLAVNDDAKIRKAAEELIGVSKAAEWKVLKTTEYEMFSNDLRRSAESLVRNAKDKNIDGAALAYVDMTLTCVKCHKHVREVRMAFKD